MHYSKDKQNPCAKLKRRAGNSRNFEEMIVDSSLITRFCNQQLRAAALMTILFLVVSNAALASTTPVQLSEAERQWLNAHPSIRLAVDIDWSPFEYIDDENQYVGMAAEYIALVGEKLGIEFEVEKEKPWSEVVESVKSGELDMYSCVVSCRYGCRHAAKQWQSCKRTRRYT